MTFQEFKSSLEKSIIHGWDDEKLNDLFEDLQDAFATDAYNAGWQDGYEGALAYWEGGIEDD